MFSQYSFIYFEGVSSWLVEETGDLVENHWPVNRLIFVKPGIAIRDGRVMGVLEVSRSIGDGQYKKHGVSCIPDVKKCRLTSEDRYIVLACDGLWKSFTPEECIKAINQILEDKNIEGTDMKSCEDVKFETACSTLANEAVLRLSADNVTILLISLREQ